MGTGRYQPVWYQVKRSYYKHLNASYPKLTNFEIAQTLGYPIDSDACDSSQRIFKEDEAELAILKARGWGSAACCVRGNILHCPYGDAWQLQNFVDFMRKFQKAAECVDAGPLLGCSRLP